MKVGFRTPSLKKRIKARTTGKIKRKMKRAVNPLYGKKGMGWINNPKKALYNKVYSKTTVDPLSSIKTKNRNSVNNRWKNNSEKQLHNKVHNITTLDPLIEEKTENMNSVNNKIVNKNKNKIVYLLLAFFLGGLGFHKFYMGKIGTGILYLIFSWTGIPSFIAYIEFFIALFKPVDEYGNFMT